MSSFETTVGVLGVLLVAGALLSGLARRSILSLAALYVAAGFAFGAGGLGVLPFDRESSSVDDLVTIVLIVLLFHDGVEVERDFLASHWRLPARKLLLGMPLTTAIVALVAHLAAGLPWLQAFLLGAVIAPTDPVLSAAVVGDRRVPAVLRHSLNVESGLNDGLALPAVLALLNALDRHGDPHFVWWQFALQDLGLGIVFGVVCGLIGSLLMPRHRPGGARDIPAHQRALYGLGIAFATYSVTVLPPHGNGLVAVFVAANVIGARRPDLREALAAGGEEIAEVAKLSVFAVFGSLLTLRGLLADAGAAAAIAAATFLLARPVAIFAAVGGSLGRAEKLFLSWFGARGVGTIAFSLLVFERHIPGGTQIFDLAAFVVVASIVVHGATDTAGARWIAARAGVTSDT